MTEKPKPIEIKRVSAGYNGNMVIEDINLDIEDRDYLAIIGPNGGGKSTLLKAILGLLEPSSGSIKVFGQSPSKAVGRVGYVPQRGIFDASYPLSVRELALMGMRHRKGLRPRYCDESWNRAEEAMEAVGISELGDRRISELSGGQLQRAFLARALAPQPDLLLLDEPMASLDPTIRGCIYDVLRKVNKRAAIVMVTHDMGIISQDVKRVACLNRRIFVHDEPEITPEMLEEGFHCPMELLAHGVPHRVLGVHVDD